MTDADMRKRAEALASDIAISIVGDEDTEPQLTQHLLAFAAELSESARSEAIAKCVKVCREKALAYTDIDDWDSGGRTACESLAEAIKQLSAKDSAQAADVPLLQSTNLALANESAATLNALDNLVKACDAMNGVDSSDEEYGPLSDAFEKAIAAARPFTEAFMLASKLGEGE